jgi:hypothetical protein
VDLNPFSWPAPAVQQASSRNAAADYTAAQQFINLTIIVLKRLSFGPSVITYKI